MAVSVKVMSLIVACLGVISFLFGVVAENKKVSICNLHKQAYHIGIEDVCSFEIEILNSKN